MMNDELKVGDRVRHRQKPEWGDGEIKNITGTKLRIFFSGANAEKELLLLPELFEKLPPAIDISAERADFIAFIRQTLTDKKIAMDPYVYHAARREWPGWRIAAKRKTDTFQAEACEKFIRLFWRKARSTNTRLFDTRFYDIDESYDWMDTAICVIPELPTLDILEVAKVGADSVADEYWQYVRRSLDKVMGLWTFEITLACKRALHGEFVKPLTNKRVAKELCRALPWGGEQDGGYTYDELIEKNGFNLDFR